MPKFPRIVTTAVRTLVRASVRESGEPREAAKNKGV